MHDGRHEKGRAALSADVGALLQSPGGRHDPPVDTTRSGDGRPADGTDPDQRVGASSYRPDEASAVTGDEGIHASDRMARLRRREDPVSHAIGGRVIPELVDDVDPVLR